MGEIVTKTKLENASVDCQTLEDCINGPADTKVLARLGRYYWTLATIDSKVNSVVIQSNSAISQINSQKNNVDSQASSAIISINNSKNSAQGALTDAINDFSNQGDSALSDLQSAINTIVIDDGVPSIVVSTANGTNQQQVNDLGGVDFWTARTYQKNNEVRLSDGTIVFSTIASNINNPNSNMTGWKRKSDADLIFDASGNNQQDINDITNERLNRGSSDLLDFIPKSQWAAILNKISVTDVSSYIDQWLAYGKTSGKVLTAPTGLFIVSKIHLIDSVSVVCNGIGKTEFKLKDNVSSTVAEAFDIFRLTGTNPTAEKFTVDGNRSNQSWEPIGSANYGLASLNATGSPFVRDVETKNVTANGHGHPVGNDPTKWINCRSHGNGKKGFHSGAVFGSLILGGEYFNNELDQGIGMHQGMNGGRIYLAKIYNNGLYGVALGSTVNTANIAKHNEISGCEMWGHATCDIFVASNNSLTDPADPATVCHANIHDNDLRSEYAIRGRFAKYVTVHDNQIHGGRMEFQNPLSTYVRNNTFINCPPDFAIKAEGVSNKTGDDFHTIGNIFNGTSCTSPIVVSGVTRYKTRDNEFNFSGTVNYPVRIYDNLDTAVINETALVRLNTFNAQFGVNDFLGIRHIKANAKPTVTEGFKIGDICYSTNPNTSGVMGWVFNGSVWNGIGLRADKAAGLTSTSTTAEIVVALKTAGLAT